MTIHKQTPGRMALHLALLASWNRVQGFGLRLLQRYQKTNTSFQYMIASESFKHSTGTAWHNTGE